MKILDFDLENRPVAYRGFDRTTSEITALAACWVGHPKSMKVWVLPDVDHEELIEGFRVLYEQADMVTGHFIRGHDLPELQMQAAVCGLEPFGPKLTEDTYRDLIRSKDLPKSQKDLAEMLGVQKPKVGMSQMQWRRANRLERQGIEEARKRVTGDVLQHMEMRVALRQAGLLKAPRLWRP